MTPLWAVVAIGIACFGFGFLCGAKITTHRFRLAARGIGRNYELKVRESDP
jgi:hypothetical protein